MIDKEKGNLVKADRFGYVKRAMHGTTMLSTRAVRCGLNLMFDLLMIWWILMLLTYCFIVELNGQMMDLQSNFYVNNLIMVCTENKYWHGNLVIFA